jgi:N-acetylmuramoyl-L-alanine amidase
MTTPRQGFQTTTIEDKPYRVVYRHRLPDVEKRAAQEKETGQKALKKKIVDNYPGHCGDDTSRVPIGDVREEHVLSNSRKNKKISTESPVTALSSPGRRYYVPFRKRLANAPRFTRLLFLSISRCERIRS